jgi:hypothetical protein
MFLIYQYKINSELHTINWWNSEHLALILELEIK